MSVASRMRTEKVTLEPMTGRDGEGAPEYGGPYTLDARVVREDRVTTLRNGTMVTTQYTLWFASDQDPLPLWHDRITVNTLEEEHTCVVEDRLEGRDLTGRLQHVRVRCREE